jgi:hypothetical protein
VNLTKNLIHFFKRNTHPTRGLSKAVRAAQLNAAISRLWLDQGTHSKEHFNTRIVPMYTALLDELKHHQAGDDAEQCLIDLLGQTATACRHRWTLRLPMKRPGSDYRKYEIIYTDALVSAMAVGCLQSQTHTQSPEQLASKILPEQGVARLKADPIVWEDWLGYFQQAERGGLYAVSIGARPAKPPRKAPVRRPPRMPPRETPPAGSGRAMLEAIRDALAQGSLSFNQPGDAVQVDRQGRTFLEHPKILSWCGEQLALQDDLKKIKNRFSRLKVHKRSTQGNQLYYGRSGKHDRRRIGYVLENPAVLWKEEAPVGHFVIENVSR